MPRRLRAYGLAVLLCSILCITSVQARAASCSGGFYLLGSYGILVGGTSPFTGGGKFLSGALTFNGACGVTGNVTSGIDGVVSYFNNVTGSYGANPDNTITVSLNIPGSGTQAYVVGVSLTSREALGIETDGTAVASIDLQPQNFFGFYSNSVLRGTYSTACTGEGAGYSDLNYVTFDGRGNLSGFDYYNNGGNQGASAPYTGTYSVASNGVISGALLNNFSQFTYYGVIDNFTNEIQFIYVSNGFGAITQCTGKR